MRTLHLMLLTTLSLGACDERASPAPLPGAEVDAATDPITEPDAGGAGPEADAGDVDTAPDSDRQLTLLEHFMDEAVAIDCQKVFHCCSVRERPLLGVLSDDERGCQLESTLFDRDQLRALVLGGKLRIREDKVEPCLDDFRAASCMDAFSSELALTACNDVFVGSVADGQRCDSSYVCESLSCSEGVCVPRPAPGAPCMASEYSDPATGACRPKKDAGSDCEAFEPLLECKDGLYCTRDGKCAARGGPGALCSIDLVNDPTCAPDSEACAGDSACRAELFCKKEPGAFSGACAPRLGDGEPCRFAACSEGSFCTFDFMGGEPSMCKPKGQDGEACELPSQCVNECIVGPKGGFCAAQLCAGPDDEDATSDDADLTNR